ncbi:MAG: cupin domain-containing protein [Anaerolineae bacterium]|nr:cupin domain-containing protein [Anaerolineae bacterium]
MTSNENGLDIGKKIRAARQSQRMSLRALAAKANVSPSMLSQIENNRANPSVTTLYNIAEALSISLNYFFPDQESEQERLTAPIMLADKTASELRADYGSGIVLLAQPGLKSPVVTLASRLAIELNRGVRWERLTATEEKDIQFLEIQYRPGASSGETMSEHGGREFGLILAGVLTLEVGGERHTLKPGDSVIFDSTTPHRLSNEGTDVMRAFWVVIDRGP